ncbi:MAG TPA: CarD family transcriptional regulator [Anaerolineales bacterium]|nr:CarD family transcriptional regulator [Anaerolineales bacterium]
MKIQEGDTVMHWTHGLGKVVRLEERTLAGEVVLYYAIQIGDMMVWVPADDMLETRLRLPTDAAEFQSLMGNVSEPGEPLPENRRERKTLLVEWLKDGRTESRIRVIRSLVTYRQVRPLNADEQAILKRSKNALLEEWSCALSSPVPQAETELHRLLKVQTLEG